MEVERNAERILEERDNLAHTSALFLRERDEARAIVATLERIATDVETRDVREMDPHIAQDDEPEGEAPRWALVELLGHKRLVGLMGDNVLSFRDANGRLWERYVAPGSVYGITYLAHEEEAERVRQNIIEMEFGGNAAMDGWMLREPKAKPAPDGWEWMEESDILTPEDFVCGLALHGVGPNGASLIFYADGHMESQGRIPVHVQEAAYAEFIRLRGEELPF